MPSNTTFKPVRKIDFTADKLVFNGVGVTGTATLGSTTNIDYLLPDDNLLQGVQAYTKTANFGDTVSLQILDTSTGAVSGTPYAVISQYVSNWRLRDDAQVQMDKQLEYPANLLAGMTLRAAYTSTGLLAVKVAVNYDLHKVLV